MRILITGGKGMLGRTLMRHWQADHTLAIADLPEYNLTDAAQIEACFAAFRPEVVVHCAAMTQVDACESKPEQAFLLNETLAALIAQACTQHQARLISISTDYVFSGDLPGERVEDDPTNPTSVYGASKLAGEEAVRRLCPNHLIIRTAWLYGSGGPSFPHTMVRLAQEDPARVLRVVYDQIGNPTSADALANALEAFLARPEIRGTFHLTCEGVASWHAFAQEVLRLTGFEKTTIEPCTTEMFPRPAPRPHNSALSKAKLAAFNLPPMPYWKDALARFVADEWPRPELP